MKNILKTMALLTLGASIVPVCATEEVTETQKVIAQEFSDTCDKGKPNTLAAYAEAGICGLCMIPTMAMLGTAGHLLFNGSFFYGSLALAGFAAEAIVCNPIADKLFSKATRQRAYEIRKAWVTLEINQPDFKQKLFDSAYFLGCMFAPLVAAHYLIKPLA